MLCLFCAQAYIVYATVVGTSVLAGYYGNLILGGVMGDFLGATIQVKDMFVFGGVKGAVHRKMQGLHSL
jgi:cobalamin synthase